MMLQNRFARLARFGGLSALLTAGTFLCIHSALRYSPFPREKASVKPSNVRRSPKLERLVSWQHNMHLYSVETGDLVYCVPTEDPCNVLSPIVNQPCVGYCQVNSAISSPNQL